MYFKVYTVQSQGKRTDAGRKKILRSDPYKTENA